MTYSRYRWNPEKLEILRTGMLTIVQNDFNLALGLAKL